MTDTPTPPPTRLRTPLAGFIPMFAWGVTRVLSRKRILLVALVAVGLGVVIGLQIKDGERALRHVAKVLDRGILKFGLALVTLLLVGEGFTYEVQARTLVYHLVRPVSRTTIFLARFFSGVLPAAAVGMALLATIYLSSGAELGAKVWLSLPVTVGLATLALGAVYYTLAAVLRHGLIAGLIYTFVVETLISSVPGSMQKLSVMFYVRSLHHGLTESALPLVQHRARGGPLLRGALSVQDATVADAVVALLAITVVALAVGAFVVSRRDWALKE